MDFSLAIQLCKEYQFVSFIYLFFVFGFLVLITIWFLLCMLFLMINKACDLSLWKTVALFCLISLLVLIFLSFGLILCPMLCLLNWVLFWNSLCYIWIGCCQLSSHWFLQGFYIHFFVGFYGILWYVNQWCYHSSKNCMFS